MSVILETSKGDIIVDLFVTAATIFCYDAGYARLNTTTIAFFIMYNKILSHKLAIQPTQVVVGTRSGACCTASRHGSSKTRYVPI
jgi:hypothetical protein